MKKTIASVLLLLSLAAFAQDIESDELLSLPVDEAGIIYESDVGDEAMYYDDSGDSLFDEEHSPGNEFNGMDTLIAMSGGIVFMIFIFVFYATMLIAPYVVWSYGLARLDMHYQKVKSSGASWIPFYRYYHIIYNATHSKQEAFWLAFAPLMFIALSVLIVVTNIIVSAFELDSIAFTIISGALIFGGIIGLIVCHFKKAFIIQNYVKGDLTTALGLSTYTGIVLWYLGLERSTGKTDIIGKIGFIMMGFFAIFYIGFIAIMIVTEEFTRI